MATTMRLTSLIVGAVLLSGCALLNDGDTDNAPASVSPPRPFVTYELSPARPRSAENATAPAESNTSGAHPLELDSVDPNPQTPANGAFEYSRCPDKTGIVLTFAGVGIETIRDWLDESQSVLEDTLLTELYGRSCGEVVALLAEYDHALRLRVALVNDEAFEMAELELERFVIALSEHANPGVLYPEDPPLWPSSIFD